MLCKGCCAREAVDAFVLVSNLCLAEGHRGTVRGRGSKCGQSTEDDGGKYQAVESIEAQSPILIIEQLDGSA